MPGFQLTFEHPIATPAPDDPHRPEVSVAVRVIWPEGATADEVGRTLTTAVAHALTEYEKRSKP